MSLTTEDRPAICELISLYGHVVDAGELERFVHPSDTDRRTITVAPTRAEIDMASQISAIEEEIYSFIDDALTSKQRGLEVSSFRTLMEGTLAGQAFARRIASLSYSRHRPVVEPALVVVLPNPVLAAAGDGLRWGGKPHLDLMVEPLDRGLTR